MTIARDTTMGEAEPVSYGIATGNRFAMVDLGDDLEDPAEIYKLIERENAAKKAEQKKKKEKKPVPKKEEVKPKSDRPETTDDTQKENTRGRGRGRGRGGRGRGDYRGGDDRRPRYNNDRPPRDGDDDRRPPRMQDDGEGKGDGEGDGERRQGSYRGNRERGGRGGGRGGYRGNRDGARQFDRRSGSDKSTVKGQEKRDGGGAHNWGSPTEDAVAEPSWGVEETPAAAATGGDDPWANLTEVTPEIAPVASGFDNIEPCGFDNIQTSGFDNVQTSGFDNIEGPAAADRGGESGFNAEPTPVEEPAPNQMTLEEYQAKQAESKMKKEFNTRKAGENEDDSQWKNFAPLKKDDATAAYMGGEDEYEKIIVRGGRKKNLVEVPLKFADSPRRGGRGRDRDGGDRRGDRRGMERDVRDGDFGPRAGSNKSPKAADINIENVTEFPSLT